MPTISVFHNRAIQLANAMKLCQLDLASYSSAAALLAVHSAISYGDAVVTKLGGTRSRAEDHLQAVQKLKRTCSSAKVEQQGVTHFQRLLGAKTDIAYGDRIVNDEMTTALCIAADRFQTWAERVLKGRRGG